MLFASCHPATARILSHCGEIINYIHNNTVEKGLVYRPEDYIYSSAKDYNGEKGLLKDVIFVDL